MGIKKILTKAADKAAGAVSKGATLSSEELKRIEEKKVQYFEQMADPTDANAEKYTESLLAAMGVEIYNEYLGHISEIYEPVEKDMEYMYEDEDGVLVTDEFNSDYNIRYINITKWVTSRKENSLEKLVSVYEVLSDENCNIALIFNRHKKGTDVYFAITNTDNSKNKIDSDDFKKRIEAAIRGNFPGSEWKQEEGIGKVPCLAKKTP